jgi:two-component system cell cycle sensor histidine kinase/response regulator CckA
VTQVEGSAGDPTAELLALVETLDATERRIEELTAGEVDSLMARDGRTFLLRRAQEQLRRNEAVRQSAILDALPARIALLDAQGVIISANAAWHAFEMFASPGTADGDNYVTACASLPGDAGESRVAAGIRTVLDGHAPSFSMEYAGLAPGPRRWFLTTVTPLGSERSGGVVVMHLETTAKWAAEESLRSSEVRFRELAESINDVFFLREAGTDAMLYVSPAYEEVWGRSCASLYADPRSRIDSVYPSDVPITLEMDATRARGEQSCFEYRIVRPDGAVRWIESRGYPVRDDAGVVRRTAGVAKDITVAKQALEKLQESEARFRTLTEASFDAIMITQDGLVLEVNAGFERMFAYPASDAVGRPVIDFYAPESVDAVRLHSVDGTSGTYELMGLRRDGAKLFLEVTMKPQLIDGREACITALRDTTARRHLEDQFRQAQKMDAIGRLAGGVAHDFNNQLAVIIAYAAFVHEELEEGDQRRADVEEIQKAANGATALTRQLLMFSRQQVAAPRVVACDAIVSGSVQMLRRLLGEDVQLVVTNSGEPATALIDPGQLEQIVMNLVVNARDAMPTGGRLSIRTDVVEHDAEYARENFPATVGRFAMIEVSDDGSGMDRATQDRAFEPFFTTKGTGTGLGLATVYGIVQQAGGSLTLHSKVGEGTTLRIFLPHVEATEDGGAHAAADPRSLAGTETIVLAEDAPAVRGAVQRILERLGYQVLAAPSCEGALRYAASAVAIDLLITDVVMPQMSGRVLAERFHELRPDLKVLYMSGYTDDAVLRHGVFSAAVNFIEKPFTAERIARTIRQILDAV